jgi:hypothetical protein
VTSAEFVVWGAWGILFIAAAGISYGPTTAVCVGILVVFIFALHLTAVRP